MKKILIPGVLAGLVNSIVGFGVTSLSMIVPAVAADYAPPLMRAWEDPLMMAFFLFPFIQAVIYAWVWSKTKELFKGTLWHRATSFGFSMWLIGTVPGMYATFTNMPFTLLTVASWTVSGLIGAIVVGLICAKMNK